MSTDALDIRFPPLPQTVTACSRLAAQDTPDLNALRRIVQADQAVSLAVLRRANSVFYGLRKPVATIERAVQFLGFETTTGLVMLEGMRSMKRGVDPAARPLFDRIIRSASFTAHFSNTLAEALALEAKALAYTSGLLHNAGRLVLLHSVPARYVELAADAVQDLPNEAEERQALWTDHLAEGGRACRSWNLPEPLTTIVEWHQAPQEIAEESLRQVAYVVSTGAYWALEAIANESGTSVEHGGLEALSEACGVPLEQVQEAANEAREQAVAFMEAMGGA